MKKRIISFVLVAVMVLGMIPVLSMTSSAADVGYRTALVADNIKVDGDLDDTYSNSQKITPTYWLAGKKSDVDFVAYTVVTIQGIYVWAEIKDSTLDKATNTAAGAGDKLQVYLRLDNGIDNAWGWYDADYNGNILKRSIMSKNDIGYEIPSGSVYSDKILADATYASVKLPDGSGWRSEMFIPFGELDPLNVLDLDIAVGCA